MSHQQTYGTRHFNNYNNNNSNVMNHNCVKFVIWHAIRELPKEEEATRTVHLDGDRVDTCILTRDWKIHLDVIEGDPRPIIARIEADFGPNFLRQRKYVSNRPRKKRNPNINHSSINENSHQPAFVWRCFESRQKCSGTPPIRFKIVGMGGTVLHVKSHPDLEKVEGYFFEKNLSAPWDARPCLMPIPLPADRAFSIEQVSLPFVGPDGPSSENSMALSNAVLPRKTSWEKGEEGITNIRQSLSDSTNQDLNVGDSKVVTTIISIRLCEGIPNQKEVENITKMSQNFIKYEDAIDKISRESMPLGVPIPPNQGLIRSNKSDVDGDTNRTRNHTLSSCSGSIGDLVKAMNPKEAQTYKLMFETDEQTGAYTARFFFYGVPDDVDFSMILLRFCILFVHNSFRFQKPKPLMSCRSTKDEVEFLFSMVVRDRFVEERLLQPAVGHNGDMSVCSFNFDIDSIEDDDVSFTISLVRDRAEDDPFDSGDGDSPDRKRLRPLTPPTSTNILQQHESFRSANSQSSNVDIIFRSRLCLENKYYTAAKLATIGKKLSTGTSNKKSERLERLKEYFDARDDELNKFFENDHQHFDSGILGIEFVFQNDADQDDNNICVILKGGRQMTTPRRNVCESKYGEKEFPIKILQVTEAKAKSIFENLYPKETIIKTFDDYVSGIDDFIEELQNDQKKIESNPCRFALIHDLFCVS